MEEKPFISKSVGYFQTNAIDTWSMLNKHYNALCALSPSDIPKKKYQKIRYYKTILKEWIREVEKQPALLIIQDKPEVPCKPMQYTGPCEAIIKTIRTFTGSGQ